MGRRQDVFHLACSGLSPASVLRDHSWWRNALLTLGSVDAGDELYGRWNNPLPTPSGVVTKSSKLSRN